jgi:lipopolysaccharide transport system ATP-binding protein
MTELAEAEVVCARDITKHFRVYDSLWGRLAEVLTFGRRRMHRRATALEDVSLSLRSGECLGIMGRNGAGKSTLLRILAGSLFPTRGEVRARGRVILLDLGVCMHPELSGRVNLLSSGIAIGLSQREVTARLDEMIAFSELGAAIEDPVKTYSTGMTMRLAFSLYAHSDPHLLIVDEALAVGDARFVLKCTRRIEELLAGGMAMLLASHDATMIARMCRRAIVIEAGRVYFDGDPIRAGDAYHTVLGLGAGGAPPASDPLPPIAAIRPLAQSSDEFLENAVLRTQESPHTQEVEIIGYKVLRNGAQCGGIFRHGDRCRIEWLIRAHRPVRQLTSGVHLHSEHGVYVFGTSYVHLGVPIEISEAADYLLAIEFPMDVEPGKYVLSLGAAEPDPERNARGGLQLDRVREALEIAVLDFELAEREPVPFLGAFRLAAVAEEPRRLR